MSQHQLEIAKWNHVWSVLFPGQQLPLYCKLIYSQPECRVILTFAGKISATARIGSLTTLEKETAEFANVYDFFIDGTNRHLTEKEKLVLVFQTHFFHRRIELEEALSQRTLSEYTGVQNAHPMIEGRTDLLTFFSESVPGPGRIGEAEIFIANRTVTELFKRATGSTTDQPSPRRSTASDPRYQGLVQIPGSSQQPTAHWVPNTYRESLQKMY
jgi:hypothetical protein